MVDHERAEGADDVWTGTIHIIDLWNLSKERIMATYPGGLPTFDENVDDVTIVAAEIVNKIQRELLGALTELGTDPAGSETDLKTRLAAGLTAAGSLNLEQPSELTISSSGITVTKNWHTVDTEGDASTDDLTTITNTTGPSLLILSPASNDRTVVIKNTGSNIYCTGNADITLENIYDFAILIHLSGSDVWYAAGFLNKVDGGAKMSNGVTSLLHMDGNDGATEFEDAAGNLWERSGGVEVDTALKVFGTGSALFPGWTTRNHLKPSTPVTMDPPGVGSYTIQFRLYLGAAETDHERYILDTRSSGVQDYLRIYIASGGNLNVYTGSDVLSAELSDETWYEICVCRDSGVLYFFVDGVLIDLCVDTNDYTAAIWANLRLGDSVVEDLPIGALAEYYTELHIDEFRYVADAVVNVGGYTPEIAAFTNSTIIREKLVQVRRGFADQLATDMETGEPYYARDTRDLYMGDGSATPIPLMASHLLSVTAAVDLHTAASTPLYVVPRGMKLLIDAVVVRDPSASLAGGTSYAVTNFRSGVNLSSMITADTDYMIIRGADVTKYAAATEGTEIQITVTTGSTGEATATVELWGRVVAA
jgi:hypothetical protein